MRFHVVLWKTLGDLLSLKRTLALVLLGVSFPLIMSFVWKNGMVKTPMSLEMENHFVLDNFSIVLFMWVAGLFLAISVATTAAGFISKEDTDGTLLLLVSKPINRFEIVLGKFLALVINALLLQVIVLLLCILLFWVVLPIDPDTFASLMGMVPWLLLYSLLVTVAFGSVALALSSVMKSRVKITLVVMLLIMLVFFVPIIPRTVFVSAYEGFYLNYADLGYHLGNVFTTFVSRAEGGQMMPQNQPFMTIFAGTYKGFQESFDPDIGALPPSLGLTEYVSPVVSMFVWLAICAAALGVAVWAVERKEVH